MTSIGNESAVRLEGSVWAMMHEITNATLKWGDVAPEFVFRVTRSVKNLLEWVTTDTDGLTVANIVKLIKIGNWLSENIDVIYASSGTGDTPRVSLKQKIAEFQCRKQLVGGMVGQCN